MFAVIACGEVVVAECVQIDDRGDEKEGREYLCYVFVALPRLAACCCVIELVTGEMTQCRRMLPAIKLPPNQVLLVSELSANCLVDADS